MTICISYKNLKSNRVLYIYFYLFIYRFICSSYMKWIIIFYFSSTKARFCEKDLNLYVANKKLFSISLWKPKDYLMTLAVTALPRS